MTTDVLLKYMRGLSAGAGDCQDPQELHVIRKTQSVTGVGAGKSRRPHLPGVIGEGWSSLGLLKES